MSNEITVIHTPYFTKRRLQDDSKTTKSTIDFDAGETLESFLGSNFPLDKNDYFLYTIAL